ncbi:MAG: amidohydrolase family protein, partial [Rhodospirillales bacterium]|nr:amidohydrolase family protein [Rhodospirillales bacterium]
ERKYWNTDAAIWGEILDDLGAEGAMLFPTLGLAHGLMRDIPFAIATATAYNSWLDAHYTSKDPRLYGVGIVPVQDPEAAAREIKRCGEKRTNFRAIVLPTANCLGTSYGDEYFWPIYEEAERQDMALTLHGAPSEGFGFDHFKRYIASHTLEHPIPIFIQLTDMMFGRVFDAFPKLRFAFLEAGCSWVPFMMDRMDYEYHSIHGVAVRRQLNRKPSEYFGPDGNIWMGMEVGEQSLTHVIDMIGSERLVYATDYPHEPLYDILTTELPEFLARDDLSEEAKANIVCNNAKKLYGIS